MMAGTESRAVHRLWLLVVALLLLALGGLIAHGIALSRRVQALEAAMARRDKADPLTAAECQWESRGHDWTAGESREHPCVVSFQRLIQAPQQFNGRWVEVQGHYEQAYEVSAFVAPYAPDSNSADPYAEALWVNGAVLPRLEGGSLDRAVGKFRRGPAGHLGEYFGELTAP